MDWHAILALLILKIISHLMNFIILRRNASHLMLLKFSSQDDTVFKKSHTHLNHNPVQNYMATESLLGLVILTENYFEGC
jgi:hypothetical protein